MFSLGTTLLYPTAVFRATTPAQNRGKSLAHEFVCLSAFCKVSREIIAPDFTFFEKAPKIFVFRWAG
jgi:hypothetical protein